MQRLGSPSRWQHLRRYRPRNLRQHRNLLQPRNPHPSLSRLLLPLQRQMTTGCLTTTLTPLPTRRTTLSACRSMPRRCRGQPSPRSQGKLPRQSRCRFRNLWCLRLRHLLRSQRLPSVRLSLHPRRANPCPHPLCCSGRLPHPCSRNKPLNPSQLRNPNPSRSQPRLPPRSPSPSQRPPRNPSPILHRPRNRLPSPRPSARRAACRASQPISWP